VKKELRTLDSDVPCDVCGRTILKGERTESYLTPGGRRAVVCELCEGRALAEGWIKESAHGDMPAALRRPEAKRGLLSRLRRRAEEGQLMGRAEVPGPGEGNAPGAPPPDPADAAEPARWDAAGEEFQPPPPPPPPSTPRDPRHVRAVPTNAQVKVERALDLFNGSEHRRTIAGVSRSLGEPWVSAYPVEDAPSEVVIVVAWELSWYRFRVDLGDADEPVILLDKGQELEELDESLREWNASMAADGGLAVGVRSPQ
jgi:hypothetical protein